MAATGLDKLTAEQQRYLLDLARRSIVFGVENGAPPASPSASEDPFLDRPGASFVTITLSGQLRGCIGSLEAYRSLQSDVVENAFASAFRDPRFPPLSAAELDQIKISISVLSQPKPVLFDSQTDLLNKIRPGIDGLILEDGHYRGTFLPVVWESLPEPEQFLHELKRKAGLPSNYWSDTLKVSRYTSFYFGEEDR